MLSRFILHHRALMLQKFEDEKMISQIVWISEGCDQNGERVSKNGKSCHICSMRLKGMTVKYEEYETLSIYYLTL